MLSRAQGSAIANKAEKLSNPCRFPVRTAMLGESGLGDSVAKKTSGRAPFDAFVAKQKLTPEEKEFLRRGLKSRAVRGFFEAGKDQPSYTRPSAAPGSVSEVLENRARKTGLVKQTGKHSYT